MYQLETTKQIYGDSEYLAHNIKGQTTEDDRFLFGMRVPSYGIFSFGALASGQTRRVVLAQEGITSPISLTSVYAFGDNTNNDEIYFRLFSGTGRAAQEIAQQRIISNDMPFQYPKGAIIDPSLSIEVEPRYKVTQIVMYWQPVHVLKYVQVS